MAEIGDYGVGSVLILGAIVAMVGIFIAIVTKGK